MYTLHLPTNIFYQRSVEYMDRHALIAMILIGSYINIIDFYLAHLISVRAYLGVIPIFVLKF